MVTENKYQDQIEPDTNQKTRRLPVWKKILFSGIIVCVFFVLLEIVLALSGVKPSLVPEDPYVGFSDATPHFVSKKRDDGAEVYATSEKKSIFLNYQEFPKVKGKNTFRIFCLGGSTTYGRPYDDAVSFTAWLRELLNAADPSKKWEVINAGGIGYASYRLAALMEELAEYEPDLLIVCSGHNEFLEKRAYNKIIERNPIITWVGDALEKTRFYTSIKKALGQWSKEGSPPDRRFLLDDDVREILNDTNGPESYTRDDTLKGQISKHFGFSLKRMVSIARSADSKILFVVPGYNLKDMSPFKSEHGSGLRVDDLKKFKQYIDKSKDFEERGLNDKRLLMLDKAVRIDNRHAETLYQRGRALFDLGRFAEAKAAFIQAKDEDVCPLRMLTPMQMAVVEVAEEQAVPIVDFMSILEKTTWENYGHSVPGKEFLLDHVHPSLEGYRLLGLSIFDKLIAMGLVHPDSSWGKAKMAAVANKVLSTIDEQKQAIALRNLGRELDWAGKHEEAHDLLLFSHEILGDRADILGELAWTSLRLGKPEEAIDYLKKSIMVDSSPDRYISHRILAELLEKEGDYDEALFHFQESLRIVESNLENFSGEELAGRLSMIKDADIDEKIYEMPLEVQYGLAALAMHEKLGYIMASLNRMEEAKFHYNKVLELRPDDSRMHSSLGTLYAKEGRHAEAIFHLRSAVKHDPDNGKAHYNLAVLLESLGRPIDAADHYKQVIRIEPDSPEPYNNLGVFFARQGQLDKAIDQFTRALKLDPKNKQAQFNLSMANAQKKGIHEPIGPKGD